MIVVLTPPRPPLEMRPPNQGPKRYSLRFSCNFRARAAGSVLFQRIALGHQAPPPRESETRDIPGTTPEEFDTFSA